jgi:dehydrogenase/reductase SDR family protein 1
MPDLQGKVAVVTGASRGVGKGVALGLGEAGATVYITGRTVEEGKGAIDLPGTIYSAAREVEALGATCIPVRCDHRDDEQVRVAFARVLAEQGRLDILVNNVWGGYEMYWDGSAPGSWTLPFWQQPVERWDAMFDAGVRAHYVSSVVAAPAMVERGTGLIVTVSFFAGQRYMMSTMYGVAKAADDRMVRDMAHELRPHGVAAVSLYPGLVRTESVIKSLEHASWDLSNSESPQFIGRGVAALAADPDVLDRSGQVLVAAALAEEYGFTDVDGKRPRPSEKVVLSPES